MRTQAGTGNPREEQAKAGRGRDGAAPRRPYGVRSAEPGVVALGDEGACAAERGVVALGDEGACAAERGVVALGEAACARRAGWVGRA